MEIYGSLEWRRDNSCYEDYVYEIEDFHVESSYAFTSDNLVLF